MNRFPMLQNNPLTQAAEICVEEGDSSVAVIKNQDGEYEAYLLKRVDVGAVAYGLQGNQAVRDE